MSILVFYRNSNFTLNYSLGIDFFIAKSIVSDLLFLELDNDVLMFPKWFSSIILSVRTMSILVFYRNLNFTLNYSLGIDFFIAKSVVSDWAETVPRVR